MPKADDSQRDKDCIQHMLKYCLDLEDILHRTDGSRERFMEDRMYQHAATMCILQLGELAKRLTADFRETHTDIPWSLIARTRDIYVHHYGSVDFEMVWETAVHDIPMLKTFCETILNQ